MLSHDLYSPVEGILNLGRLGADLDGVRSMGRVLKQSIVWVEQLSGELEEKLTLWTTVVESRQVAEFKSHIKHQGSRFKVDVQFNLYPTAKVDSHLKSTLNVTMTPYNSPFFSVPSQVTFLLAKLFCRRTHDEPVGIL